MHTLGAISLAARMSPRRRGEWPARTEEAKGGQCSLPSVHRTQALEDENESLAGREGEVEVIRLPRIRRSIGQVEAAIDNRTDEHLIVRLYR